MGNRLLLADDSITIQKVVAIIFANEEFELTVVDNGTAALDKARELQPDLMLVDALMPGKTGYEVCAEIRRDPKLNAIPLLLLIGAFEPLDEEKARTCGADASISKPFESQQLIDKVKELIELGKTRQAAPVAAAPAAPAPEMAGAEDIWGDLSSLDTMTSFAEAATETPASSSVWEAAAVATPAAPAAPQPPAAPAAPAAPAFAAPAVSAPAVEEEIVESSFEDDLWGAFDLEEEAEPATVAGQFGVIEPDAGYEADQFFTFEDESAEIEETGPALELVEEPPAQPSAEELFSLEEDTSFGYMPEPVTEAAPAAEPQPLNLPDYEPFSFEEEPAEPAAAPAFEEPPAAFEAAPAAPAAPAALAASAAPAAQPAAAVSAEPAQVGVQPAAAAPSEEAIVAALRTLSKEVIERIVWEVVPDLAEVLIKEEIKKLKAGVRG